jgi:hypothetical protein
MCPKWTSVSQPKYADTNMICVSHVDSNTFDFGVVFSFLVSLGFVAGVLFSSNGGLN